MTAYDRVIDKLTSNGAKIRTTGEGRAMAQCPAHDDGNPSLSITRAPDRVLVNCQAGCDTDEVLAVLDLTRADLFDTPHQNGTARQIVATYDYRDEAGTLLYQGVRYEPKDFRVRRPDGHGGWIWNLKDTRKILYRLPQVIQAVAAGQVIHLVEGEKDVHALESIGAVATTAPMGAGNFHLVDATPLHGAQVVAVVDNDAGAGRNEWAPQVRKQLDGLALSLTFVQAAEGKDAHDHIASGHGVNDFHPLGLDEQAATEANIEFNLEVDKELRWQRVRLAAKKKLDMEPTADNPARTPMIDRLLTISGLAKLEPTKPLIRGLLYRNTIAQLSGSPGQYKSFLAVAMACSVALGRNFEDHIVPEAGPVIYVAAEGATGIHARILAWCSLTGVDPADLEDQLYVLPMPIQLNNTMDVAEAAEVARNLGALLLILDTRARCTLGLEENSATEQGRAIEHTEQIQRRCGATVLTVHHSGREGSHGRGSTAWDGALWSDLRMKGDELRAEVECAKHKDVPDGCKHYFRLIPHTVPETMMPGADMEARSTLVLVQNDAWTSPAPDGKNALIVQEILWTIAPDEGLTGTQLRDLAIEQGASKSGAYESINVLVKTGFLRNIGTEKRRKYVASYPRPEVKP